MILSRMLLQQFTIDSLWVLSCGNWNGHIGKTAVGYDGGNGYVDWIEGDRALDFAVENNFAICYTFFQKRDNHPITYLVSLKPRVTLSWLERISKSLSKKLH